MIVFLAARTGDVAAAEDALSMAVVAALAKWPAEGIPNAPEAWLLEITGRHRRKTVMLLGGGAVVLVPAFLVFAWDTPPRRLSALDCGLAP